MQAAPNQQPIRKSKRESKKEKKKYDTLKKELLNSLIGIHGTLLKHCINLILSGIHCDLLDVIDHLLYVDWDWNPAGPTNAHLCKPRNLINTQNKITTKPHQHQYHHRPQSVNLSSSSSSSSSSSFKRLEKSLFVLFVQLHTTTEIMQEMKGNQKKKKKESKFFSLFFWGFLNLIYVNVRRKKKRRQERDREREREMGSTTQTMKWFWSVGLFGFSPFFFIFLATFFFYFFSFSPFCFKLVCNFLWISMCLYGMFPTLNSNTIHKIVFFFFFFFCLTEKKF